MTSLRSYILSLSAVFLPLHDHGHACRGSSDMFLPYRNINAIAVILLIPVFDYVIYPALRSVGINYTPIKRIYTGFLVCGVALLYSAILQNFVYKESPCHDNHPSGVSTFTFELLSVGVGLQFSRVRAECLDAAGFPNPAPINVWVISGPYIIVSVSEIFTVITSLEYAFTKVRPGLISFISSHINGNSWLISCFVHLQSPPSSP